MPAQNDRLMSFVTAGERITCVLIFDNYRPYLGTTGVANQPPVFKQDMNNVVLSEDERIGNIVYRLEGYDPEGSNVTFGLLGSSNFHVDEHTGDVSLIKALDREVI